MDEPRTKRSTAAAFDPIAHYYSAGASPRSFGGFVRTAQEAVALVRASAPRLARISTAANVALVLALVGQVILSKLALEGILAAVSEDGTLLDAIPPLVGVIALGTVTNVLGTVVQQIQRLLGEHVRARATRSILDVTTSVELARFESPAFFDALQRVQLNAMSRPLTMTQGLLQTFAGAVGVVVLVVVLLVIEPLLVPLLLFSAVPLMIISRLTGRAEFDFTVRQTTGVRMRTYLSAVLTGRDEAKEVRAFDLSAALRRRWEDSEERYLDDIRVHVRRQLGRGLAGAAITTVLTSATFAVLVAVAVDGRITLAEAGAAVVAVRLLSSRVQQLSRGVSSVFESSLFLQEYAAFLQEEVRVPQPSPTGERPSRLARLELQDVRFRYPESDQAALDGITLSCSAGEVVAVVGANGSGKTTLAKLIGGLFDPTGGSLRWIAENGSELERAAVRGQVGFVFQDFIRFSLTARDNVALGLADREVEDALVLRAAERAGARDFLEALPSGIQTGLGKEFPGGHDLSGGQWQRVALARAFLRDAPFLVLDEPSAALDARSEHELFEHVRELARGRGVLLISHRFSTVVSADRIVVMDAGRVLEQGTHEELIAARGTYAELFDLQAAAYR